MLVGTAEVVGSIRNKRDYINYLIGGTFASASSTLFLQEYAAKRVTTKLAGITCISVLYSHLVTQLRDFERYTKDTGHKMPLDQKFKQLFGISDSK